MRTTKQIILHGIILRWSFSAGLWASAFATDRLRPTSIVTSRISDSFSHHPYATATIPTTTITALRAGAQDDVTRDSFSELTSALAKLDKEQQRSKSRWSKLFLPREDEHERGGDRPETSGSGRENADILAATTTTGRDYVWMLEPPVGRIPSCVIIFTGGAGLGQFPHIAYNELLSRVSDRLNAVVLASHYSVGLDHFRLSKQTGEHLRRALVHCQDDPNRPYMSADQPLPTYSLAHSLGCKLQTIYMVATRQDYLNGMGFLAYNNFSFAKTLKMARAFTKELRNSSIRARTGTNPSSSSSSSSRPTKSPFGNLDSDSVISGIFDFAEMAAGAIGVDFSPTADDTERLIQLRYDDLMQTKTRLFVFDDDDMDSSLEFVKACSGGSADDDSPSVSGLPGGHLAPVYFQWKVDDVTYELDGDLPPEAREMAKEAMGGFQGASFGDELTLNALVDEICSWILGKPPTRGPVWARDDNVYNNQDASLPRISDGR